MKLNDIFGLIALLLALLPAIIALRDILGILKNRRNRLKGRPNGRRTTLIISILLSVILVIVAIVLFLVPPPTHTCKPVPPGPFSVDVHYAPSGKMGDILDITIKKDGEVVRFTYETTGRGPHEWEYKYIGGELNPQPAQFGGVMYLDPPNNWGWDSKGGFDLRNPGRFVKWEARSLNGPVNVEFVIGGIEWQWDDKSREKIPAPYPDSMPRTSLGVKTLTEDWQPFEKDLSQMPEDYFRCIIGGFGWVIDWGSNGVQVNEAGTGPEQPKTFEIEIRNVRYEG